MRKNKQAIAQLKRDEGFVKDKAGFFICYYCTGGALTAGFGHNLDANPVAGLNANSKLTEEQAERLLIADIIMFEGELDRLYPWWRGLNEPRQADMLNMIFNLGAKKIQHFKTSLGFIERGEWDAAAKSLLANKTWHSQIGDRLDRIVKQIKTGQWV